MYDSYDLMHEMKQLNIDERRGAYKSDNQTSTSEIFLSDNPFQVTTCYTTNATLIMEKSALSLTAFL